MKSSLSHTRSVSQTLAAALFVGLVAATAVANDFTGTVDDNWFEDGNWSDGHVPLSDEHVFINGFDVHAYDSAGDTLRGVYVYLTSWHGGPGSASLYSEVPIDVTGLRIAHGRFTPGLYSGTLTVVGADVILDGHLDIADADGGPGYTCVGDMTISDGSLFLPASIQIGQADNNGGITTGSLAVINGDIVGESDDGLYCGETSSERDVTSTSTVRLENGRLEGMTEGYFGYAYGSGSVVHCDAAFINAECLLEGDVYVAYGSAATATLVLDNAYFRSDYIGIDEGAIFQMHVDGTERAAEGNVSTPGKYAAIDLIGYEAEFEPDTRLELHFGYTPALGDGYDLIRCPVGEVFDGMFAEIVAVDLAEGFAIEHEIVPGDALNGEILRITVIEDTTGVDGPPDVRGLAIRAIAPNPFNPRTEITFETPSPSPTTVAVYDTRGRRVDVLYEGESRGGPQTVVWNADGAADGLYFVRVDSDGETATRKMALVK